MADGTCRQEKGYKTSILMASGNFCLFLVYIIVGTMGNSIAVVSEGIDNLIDACNSLLMLLGFKISGRGKDSMHPNGHGRIEYITGLLISEMVLLAAFALGKESVGRLLHPEPVGALFPILLTAAAGAGVKMAMAKCIEKENKEMKSPAMEAYQKNVLADIKGIILVAVTPVLHQLTSLPVDGIAGLLLAGMIAVDGIKSFMKNVSLLLGEGLSREETERIAQILRPYGSTVQMELFEFHDYGPEERGGIMVLSVHPGILHHGIQSIMDDCKQQIEAQLNIHVSVYIHMNRENTPDRAYASPRFDTVRQYLKLWTSAMDRSKRRGNPEW